MIGIVKRYVCDACRCEECVGEDEVKEGWTKTEEWDLCPSCTRAWQNFKSSFIEQMRKEHREDII